MLSSLTRIGYKLLDGKRFVSIKVDVVSSAVVLKAKYENIAIAIK